MKKILAHSLCAAPLALAPSMASAQTQAGVDYATDTYEFAEPLAWDAGQAEAAQDAEPSQERDTDVQGAERVIMERRSPSPTVFAPRPVVQPIQTVEPDAYATREEGYVPHSAADTRRTAADGPRYVYRAGQVPSLPAGARVVQFDPKSWLGACADRLTPANAYEDEDGDGKIAGAVVGAVVGGLVGNRIAGRGNRTAGTLIGAGAGALGGMAVGGALDRRERSLSGDYEQGYAYSYERCEAYLDQYMASALSGGLDGRYSATGDYMLVPVTVEVPQRAYYSDGTPVRR